MGFEKYPPLSWDFLTQHFTLFSDKFKISLNINPTRLILQFPKNISWTPISLLSQFVQKSFQNDMQTRFEQFYHLMYKFIVYDPESNDNKTIIEQFIDLIGNGKWPYGIWEKNL